MSTKTQRPRLAESLPDTERYWELLDTERYWEERYRSRVPSPAVCC